jgi:phage/plasmid-associated DNA primase
VVVFLDRCTAPRVEGFVTAAALYDRYLRWCRSSGPQPMSRRALSLSLQRLGVQPYRTSSERGWRHIALS